MIQAKWERLSGLTKQDYITRRLMCRDIVVQGNPRVYKALRNQMAEIYEELKRLEKCGEDNEELLYTIQLVAETLNGMKEEGVRVQFAQRVEGGRSTLRSGRCWTSATGAQHPAQ